MTDQATGMLQQLQTAGIAREATGRQSSRAFSLQLLEQNAPQSAPGCPRPRWYQMGRSRDDVTGDEHEQRRAKRREDGCANPSAILSERL